MEPKERMEAHAADIREKINLKPGMKTEFAFLAGSTILQGVGLFLLFQTAVQTGNEQMVNALYTIVVYIVAAYFAHIYNKYMQAGL